MTTYTQEASGINTTAYDLTNPFQALTSGEGAPGMLKMTEDQVKVPRTGFGTAGNFVRLLRFPSNAKVKSVELMSDLAAVDGGTSSSALVLTVGVVFSDSTIDGTPVSYQNQMPTTVGIGGGTTTAGTTVAIGGASYNQLFGTITANSTTGNFATAYGISTGSNTLYGGPVTFDGTIATYGEPLAWTQIPLLELFNFRDGSNSLITSLGYFDIIIIATTQYNTQPSAAYNIYGRMTFVA